MGSVSGKVAVVTGAAGGIGRQLALCLAGRGARLSVCDVDEDGLSGTVDALKDLGAEVHAARVDVGDPDAVRAYATAVAEHYGVVHQVYNNAAVAGGWGVLDTDWADYDRVIRINLLGVVYGTKAFLPHLIASGDGHVVNFSSLNGYLAQPTVSAYSAAKFGVRGFTESLRGEMLAGRFPVRVTVVHPSGVATGIMRTETERLRREGRLITEDWRSREKVYSERLLRRPPEDAARIVVSGVEAGRSRIVFGADAKALDVVVRLFPRLYPRLTVLAERRLFR